MYVVDVEVRIGGEFVSKPTGLQDAELHLPNRKLLNTSHGAPDALNTLRLEIT